MKVLARLFLILIGMRAATIQAEADEITTRQHLEIILKYRRVRIYRTTDGEPVRVQEGRVPRQDYEKYNEAESYIFHQFYPQLEAFEEALDRFRIRDPEKLLVILNPQWSKTPVLKEVLRFGTYWKPEVGSPYGEPFFINETFAFPELGSAGFRAFKISGPADHISQQIGPFYRPGAQMMKQFFKKLARAPQEMVRSFFEAEAGHRPVYTPQLRWKLEWEDENLDYDRMLFIVFRDFRTQEIESMLSLYDGSFFLDPDKHVPVAQKYPKARELIYTRENEGRQIIELRRWGAKNPSISQMRRMGIWLAATIRDYQLQKALFVGNADEGVAEKHRKIGMHLIAGPAELGVPNEHLSVGMGAEILATLPQVSAANLFRLEPPPEPQPYYDMGLEFDARAYKGINKWGLPVLRDDHPINACAAAFQRLFPNTRYHPDGKTITGPFAPNPRIDYERPE